MNGFRRFMMGRYGSDQFGMALIIFGLALSIGLSFVPVPYLNLLGYAPLVFAIYRMFSRNIAQRQKENYKFFAVLNSIKTFPRTIKARSADRKRYRYFKCPKCSQKLRVPRGKGKINITCSKCGEKFQKVA